MNQINLGKKRDLLFVLVSAFLGVVVGFLYLGFEWVVNHGTNWLWNDIVQSDVYRWRVIPFALIMGLLFSAVILIFKKKRVLKPSLSLLDELDDVKKTSIGAIIIILIIGALSLLAGASLGPEASLVAASMGTAAWLSGKLGALKQPIAFALSIASIGALLAAFFNSLLPVIIPLLILKQKGKLNATTALVTIFSGTAAWGIVRVIKNEAYIEIPVSGVVSISNIALAALLGFISVAIVLAIKWTIHIMFPRIEKISIRLPWLVSASVFGLVLGLLYFIGGQTVQFSGSEGLKLLSENPAQYGVAALLGLLLIKLLATTWSLTTGYRGGLVFPSIYMGVVFSLAFSTLFGLSGATEAGTIIGAVTGVLMGMINPIVGIVLALALFPFSLIVIVLGSAIGSFIALKLFTKLLPSEKT